MESPAQLQRGGEQLAQGIPLEASVAGTSGHIAYSSAGSPVRTVTFVLANTILGAGMLGLPSAFASCGLLVGYMMLVLFAMSATYSLHLLSECADRVGRPATFHKLCDAAMPGFSVIFDGAIAIKCFGVATSYLIVRDRSPPEYLLHRRYFASVAHTHLLRDIWEGHQEM